MQKAALAAPECSHGCEPVATLLIQGGFGVTFRVRKRDASRVHLGKHGKNGQTPTLVDRPYMPSINVTNDNGVVLVGAVQSCNAGTFQYNPTNSILFLEPMEIGGLETIPAARVSGLPKPVFSKGRLREHRHRARVLDGIG